MRNFKTIYASITAAFLLSILSNCSQNNEYREDGSSSPVTNSESNSASLMQIDPLEFSKTHKIVKTAHFKIENQDALIKSLEVEKLTNRLGGLVLNSTVETIINERVQHRSGLNSSTESIRYVVHSKLTINVPEYSLDTLAELILSNNLFVHQKKLEAEDVRWKLIESYQTEQRSKKSIHKSEKQTDTSKHNASGVFRIEKEKDWEEANDRAFVNRLQLEDRMAHSLIYIDIVQPEQIKQIAVLDKRNASAGFFTEIKSAFIEGFDILKSFIVFIIGMWSVWLIIALLVFSYLKLLRYSKKKRV